MKAEDFERLKESPELLIPRKVYEISVYENDLVRVIDEAGEAAIYPADFFMLD
jgi:hypothetical protein